MLLLILLNGFFVAGEFALVSVDRQKVEQLAEEGRRTAQSALRALKTLSFQLSGAQLGITVTSLLIGFIAEPTLGRALEPVVETLGISERSASRVSVALALVVATATQMVLAELIPQNLGIARSLRVGFFVAPPLRFFNTLFKPLIVLLNAAANWTVRLFGIEPRDELISVHSLEELEVLIHSSRKEGALPEEDFALLARSISFGDKTAADALVPRTSILALQADDTVAQMAQAALESGHSRFPVYGRDLDDIVGVAHVKDAYRIPLEERDRTPVSAIMQDALVVPESRGLEPLLTEMRRERRQISVVVDEYGGTAGIITFEDILEEIVGEIEDEHDPASATLLTTPLTGAHILPGLLHPDEVRDATGFVMPEGDYDTLAGFLLSLFTRIPAKGDHASYNEWEFKVVAMDGRRIAQVLVVAPPEPHTEERT